VSIGTSTIGTEAELTREELRRRERERFATRSGWPELKRSDLTITRFAVIHQPTGDEFRIYTGEINNAIGTTHPASAYFYDQAGGVVFLERLPGAKR
jgi:hypothetical protein